MILTMLLVFPLIAHAQKWNISGEIFYGTFKMNSMKDLQEDMTLWYKNNNNPSKIVNNFPAYVGYNVLAGYSVSPRVDLGGRFQYTSTGGRIDYGDYSGQVRYDNLLRSNSIGIFTTIRLANSPRWPVYFSFATGAARTSLKIVNYFRLLDNSSSYRLSYRSINYFFNPAFNFNRKLNDHFRMYVSTGYEFQIDGSSDVLSANCC